MTYLYIMMPVREYGVGSPAESASNMADASYYRRHLPSLSGTGDNSNPGLLPTQMPPPDCAIRTNSLSFLKDMCHLLLTLFLALCYVFQHATANDGLTFQMRSGMSQWCLHLLVILHPSETSKVYLQTLNCQTESLLLWNLCCTVYTICMQSNFFIIWMIGTFVHWTLLFITGFPDGK